jgi:hypothetical protein
LTAPAGLAERALEYVRPTQAAPRPAFQPLRLSLGRTLSLLRAQAYLIQSEMWPTSAAVMALGVIVALLSNHVEALSFLAPLVAAASLAMLYGPEHDPAHELVLSTPTSTWKILLARLSVVSAYNLLLALLAGLAMLLIVPPHLLGLIILGWLAPMACLSALALLLSLWIGAANAVTLAYTLWVIQYVQISQLLANWRWAPGWDAFLSAYRSFWQSPGLLFGLSLILLGAALLSTRFTERRLPHPWKMQ